MFLWVLCTHKANLGSTEIPIFRDLGELSAFCTPHPSSGGGGVVGDDDDHFFELPPTGTETYPKHNIVLPLSSEIELSKVGPQNA